VSDAITCIYYTANREHPAFEEKIRANLLRVNPWPLISVSQQPLPDFGENICVGDVGMHDANALRQIQIGVEAAKTPFVATAEADALYPADYFAFVPPSDGCWRYSNVWILSMWVPRSGAPIVFQRKRYSECAQIVGRDFFLRHLEKNLAGRPLWSQPDDIRPGLTFRLKPPEWTLFDGPVGIVNVKTGRGLRMKTRTLQDEQPVEELSVWGNAGALLRWLGEGTATRGIA
jgi:hypothetical protein